MALKVGELFASFNLDTSGIDSAVSGAEKSLSNIGKGLTIGGAAMTAAVTVPLVKAAKDIYSAGSSFDAQMAKVFAIAGDSVTSSAEKMDALRAKALEMGSTTQFTASQAGEAFEYMAMAGWKTEQMLSGIEPLMNLAAAAGADLGTTSDIVTDAMTAFGLAATDTVEVVKDGMKMNVNAVEYFADILAATSSNSNTNVTMLGESFKYAAPLAGSLGYSLNDVAVALGLMANNGIKSSMAGTSLSRVIQNMAKPSDQTAIAMEKLGLSLYDSKGNVKSLRDLMNDFRGVAKKNNVDITEMTKKVGDLDAQFKAGKITEAQYEKELTKLTEGSGDFLGAITQIAGARGLPGLLAIMNATDKDFDSLVHAIDNATGSAGKMKQVMLDNVEGAVTILKSAVEGLEITLWGLVKGPVKSMIERATTYVDAFRKMDSATQEGVLRMAAYAASIGPAMTGSGMLLTVLPKIAKGIALMASPLGLVSIGLLAVGAASMDAKNLMGKNLEKMAKSASASMKKVQKSLLFKNWVLASRGNKFLDSVIASIKEAGPVFMDMLSSLLMTGISAVGRLMPKAAETATTLVKTITDGIARHAPALMRQLGRSMTSLATSVIGAVPDMLNAGMTLFNALIDAAGKVDWLSIGTKLNTAIKDALKEIRTNFYTLVFGEEPTAEDLGDWGKLGAKITENIKAGIKTASDNGKNLIGGLVLGKDYEVSDTWGEVAQKIWDKITEGMSSFLTKGGELIAGIVLGEDYKPDSSWADVGLKIWNTIKSGITATGDWVKELVLGEEYSPEETSWSDVGKKIWASIKTGIKETGDWIKSLVLGEEYTPESSWSEVGKKIWESIKTGITATGDWIKQLILGNEFEPDSTWADVGGKIWNAIKSGISSAGDWIKELVLSGDYSADDSWRTVGTKIWAKIKSGLGSIPEKIKAQIGKLTLGDNYDPGTSWSTIGEKIWEKIKSGLGNVAGNLKELVSGLMFEAGEEGYEADQSWAEIGQKILEKIKSGLSSAGEGIKQFFTDLLFEPGEDGYEVSATWSEIGEKLWEKVQSGITAGKDIAAAILEKIGTVNIDVAGILTTVQNAGTFVTNLVSNMLDGRITWGNEITGLAQKIADQLAAYGWDDIGNTLGKVANNLISAITGAIPKAIDAAGNAVDVGLTLADGILSSVSSALTGEGLDLNLSAIVQSLVNNLIRILPKAFTVGEEAVSAGFKLATSLLHSITEGLGSADITADLSGVVQSFISNLSSIMSNGVTFGTEMMTAGAKIAQTLFSIISDALADVEASGIAKELGKAATDLLKNLLQNIGGLSGNEEVTTFLTNLGTSIMESMGTLGSIVGDFAGQLIGYLFSVEGLTDLMNAGVTIGNLIFSGIMQGLTGIGNFLKEMITSTLVSWGVLDAEEVKAAKEAGTELARLTAQAFNEAGKGEFKLGAGMEGMLNWANYIGGQNRSEITPAAQNIVSALNAALYGAAKESDTGKAFRDAVLENLLQSDKNLETELYEALGNPDFEWSDSWTEMARELGKNFEDYIPNYEDIGFWDSLLEALKSENTSEIMKVINDAIAAAMAGAEEQTEELANGLSETVTEIPPEVEAAAEELRKLSGEAEKAVDTVTQAIDESGNQLAQNGVATAIKENAGAVEAEALSLGNDTVQTFLMTMSAENGQAIGRQFIDGIIAILDDGTLVSAADVLGQSAFTSLSNALSGAAGVSIGRNFGLGLANGISSMTGAVTSAAWNLGISAANALSSAIQEGSPSKLTYKSGGNFGLGFINSIMDMSDNAAEAAASMGRSAAKALEYTVQDIGAEASRIDYPLRSGYDRAAEAYHAERQNDPAIEQMADRIIEALGHMAVCIDGEPAGQILTPYVSEIMAHGTSVRR